MDHGKEEKVKRRKSYDCMNFTSNDLELCKWEGKKRDGTERWKSVYFGASHYLEGRSMT